jgi:hypothetical protein
MKLKLSNGLDYGEGPDGKRVCRGALMGRPNNIPPVILSLPSVKLHLERLKMYDGDCYDAGGCYWGSGNGTTHMYCAWGTVIAPSSLPYPPCQIFVRARSRKDAKSLVRGKLKNATFYC